MNLPAVVAALEPVFRKAQSTDEFEYACTLLRPRGAQTAGWEPLAESEQLLADLFAIFNGPLRSHSKVRLALVMYCHIVEMSAPYDVIGNMLRVCQGERYTIDVCQVECAKKIAYPIDKIGLIKGWAETAGFSDVGGIFDPFFENKLRNAFFHSDYVLHEGDLNIVSGSGLNIGGQITRSIPIESELMPRIQAACDFVGGLLRLVRTSLRAYAAPKAVRGRINADGSYGDVELDVEPGVGLVGFHGYSC